MALPCRSLVSCLHTKRFFKDICQQWNIKLTKVAFTTDSRLLSSNISRSNNNITRKKSMLRKSKVNSKMISPFRSVCTSHGVHGEHSEDKKVYTHFGYEKVEENEKVNKVYSVFENVAKSYDLMNDVMSVGAHRLWKAKFVEQLNVRPGMKILDMAGGTGDIAFKMFDHFASRYPNLSTSKDKYPDIIISDINENMLDVGKNRALKLGIDEIFQWVQADAEQLPFEDESFDLYTIAFGIRNVTHIEKVLEEAFRVLKIGGRLSCLEFSMVENPIISELYDNYSFQVIPVMGQVLANDWNSYQYLVESIRKFPKQEDFADMIYDSGFSNVRFENLLFGAVAIHDAFKI